MAHLAARVRRACAALGCLLVGALLLAVTSSPVQTQAGEGGARHAVQMSIDGAIGPASADYFLRGLSKAGERNAAAIVLRIDTPGGLDTSMREIIRGILSSPVPVLTYVAPSGARAASAGTYILYASHVAAMAPGTNLGAATPVSIGGGGFPMPGREPAEDPRDAPGARDERPASAPDAGGPAPSSAMERKILNDAVAYIRGLALRHGRNAEWAESAVRDAASLTAVDARERKVIDIVAGSVADLLAQAHGRKVRLGESTVTLDTRGLDVVALEPDLRSRVLGVIGNPNLALILLMIGVYGLLFEFMNPGAIVPGMVGAICLLIGLYSLSALPLNYAGLGLLALGVLLLVAEVFSPSAGALGIGGVIAFVIGAAMVVDPDTPGFAVSLPLVAGIAVAGLLTTLLIARLALGSRRHRVVSGTQAMVGTAARVLDWSGDAGHVFADGERWRAVGARDLRPGQQVTIKAVRGVTVEVASDAAPGVGLPPSGGPARPPALDEARQPHRP
jgi:membrane-bound serine protease (ClpP class)